MPHWKGRVEDLLYDGESVQESIELGSARVVVTTHRVLAFTPEIEGANFRQVDRPNVVSVGTDAESQRTLLERGVRFGGIGSVLVIAGLVFDFGSIIGDASLDGEAAQKIGAGGLISVINRFMRLMAQLDYLLRVFGLLGIGLAVVLLGVYWFLRTPTLVISVAGDEKDIHLPRPDEVTDAQTRLETAIFPDPDEDRDAIDDQERVVGQADDSSDSLLSFR